ncbi:ABC transporter permease [Chloroflexota bacterium]
MDNDTADSSSGELSEKKGHSRLVSFAIRLATEKPLGTVGAAITFILLFTGIFADFLAPYGMNETSVADSLTAPSAKFWLGTDNLGRDIFSRVIFGARISMIVGLAGTSLATLLAVIIGIPSGYFGGKFDLIIQRVVDAFMCFPGLIFLIVLISMVGPGIWQVIVVLGLRWGITGSRVVRSATLGIRQNVYVEAAVSVGCSPMRILTKHILPNIMAPLIILFSTRVPNVIITEASLSFLGFGIPPPTPSWGGMLSGAARNYMYVAPWIVIWPGIALSIVVYGVNMFGDAVRDLLDPRLIGGAVRYGVKVSKVSESKSDKKLKII